MNTFRWTWPLAVAMAVVSPLVVYRMDPVLVALAGVPLLMASVVASMDGWIALLAGYLVLRWLLTPLNSGYEVVLLVAAGGFMVVAIRQMPDRWREPVHTAILTVGVIQVVVILLQLLQFDPGWNGFARFSDLRIQGTFGNPNHVGAYLAMTLPLVPDRLRLGRWTFPTGLLPLWVVGLMLSQSILAVLAAGVALCVRYRQHWAWWVTLPGMAFGLAGTTFVRGTYLTSVSLRLSVWRFGLRGWFLTPWTTLLGQGPAAWAVHPPVMVNTERTIRETATWMHNDFLQLGFEGGLVAVAIVVVWLVVHRQAFLRLPYGPCLVGIALVSFGSFPFHKAALAMTACVLIGSATREVEDA